MEIYKTSHISLIAKLFYRLTFSYIIFSCWLSGKIIFLYKQENVYSKLAVFVKTKL